MLETPGTNFLSHMFHVVDVRYVKAFSFVCLISAHLSRTLSAHVYTTIQNNNNNNNNDNNKRPIRKEVWCFQSHRLVDYL
jgi:hypothetical protein